MPDRALILTAQLPKDLHHWATSLRTKHFPPERNYLEAHVTLFHALPGSCENEASDLCARLASEYAPVDAQLIGVMSLGRGTAIKLSSEAMLRLRANIADHFHGMQTQQDQHAPRLHVTIQNKVAPTEAKKLQAALEGTVQPRYFAFRGLELFRYLGGPWEPIRAFPFRGREKA